MAWTCISSWVIFKAPFTHCRVCSIVKIIAAVVEFSLNESFNLKQLSVMDHLTFPLFLLRALSESLITPLELKMEEWKKVASQLDKDHTKGMPAGHVRRHMRTASCSRCAFLSLFIRVQKGQSRHQEKVFRHHQTAKEGEKR